MASTLTRAGGLAKFRHLGTSTTLTRRWNMRSVFAATTRPLQDKAEKDVKETHRHMKDAAREVKKTAQDVREKVNMAADQMVDKTIETAGKMVNAVQNQGIKKTVETAWGSAKETAQKVKDTVVGAAEETKEGIKGGADNVKRKMNNHK